MQATGRVGPAPDGYTRQRIIAGRLPNTQQNLARWLLDPAAVSPDTAMPYVGLTEREAAEIAAFLHTLDE